MLVIVHAYRHITALHNISQLVCRRRMYVFLFLSVFYNFQLCAWQQFVKSSNPAAE